MRKELPDKLEELFRMMNPQSNAQQILEKVIEKNPAQVICIYVNSNDDFQVVCSPIDCSKAVGYLERAKTEILSYWLDEPYPDEDDDEDED